MTHFYLRDGKLAVCGETEPCLHERITPASDDVVKALVKHQKPYAQWHEGLAKMFLKYPDLKYGKKTAKPNTARFQMVNFLAHHPTYAFTRSQLDFVQRKLLESPSTDIIQVVNKTDQGGLERFYIRWGGSLYYSLPALVYTDRHLRKREVLVTKEELDQSESKVRAYYKRLAEDKYETGHKDPRKPLDESNSVRQPATINRSFKDNYIFDHNGLPKAINPDKFAENPARFYSKKDRKIMYDALRAEFGDQDSRETEK